MSKGKQVRGAPSNAGDIASFIEHAERAPVPSKSARGRLIFSLDATASRQPTWDMAAQLQSQMFEAVAGALNLQLQLCYYRGINECRHSRWFNNALDIQRAMQKISCSAGQTQIERILKHALAEHKQGQISAVVFVGDCVEENVDQLAASAGKMGLKGLPLFVFQEGHDRFAASAFAELARLSGGAYCRFDRNSADQLLDLLCAVVRYATGGLDALLGVDARSALVSDIVRQLSLPANKHSK